MNFIFLLEKGDICPLLIFSIYLNIDRYELRSLDLLRTVLLCAWFIINLVLRHFGSG